MRANSRLRTTAVVTAVLLTLFAAVVAFYANEPFNIATVLAVVAIAAATWTVRRR